MKAAVYRAVVEVFAALGAGNSLTVPDGYLSTPLLNYAHRVSITLSKSKGGKEQPDVRLQFPTAAIQAAVLQLWLKTPTTTA